MTRDAGRAQCVHTADPCNTAAPRTVASVCRAVGMLDAGGNRLVDWLAHEACVRRLKLSAVVGFRNGDFERAASKLRGRLAVVAVWPRWLAGEGGLRNSWKPPAPSVAMKTRRRSGKSCG
jgi:hypothetical protein